MEQFLCAKTWVQLEVPKYFIRLARRRAAKQDSLISSFEVA